MVYDLNSFIIAHGGNLYKGLSQYRGRRANTIFSRGINNSCPTWTRFVVIIVSIRITVLCPLIGIHRDVRARLYTGSPSSSDVVSRLVEVHARQCSQILSSCHPAKPYSINLLQPVYLHVPPTKYAGPSVLGTSPRAGFGTGTCPSTICGFNPYP